jgi:hypothetical protein
VLSNIPLSKILGFKTVSLPGHFDEGQGNFVLCGREELVELVVDGRLLELVEPALAFAVREYPSYPHAGFQTFLESELEKLFLLTLL